MPSPSIAKNEASYKDNIPLAFSSEILLELSNSLLNFSKTSTYNQRETLFEGNKINKLEFEKELGYLGGYNSRVALKS